jgi:hypothetical protein
MEACIMKLSRLSIACLSLFFAASASAAEPFFQDELLDRLVGDWVMRGTIAGEQVTHDVSADWVLGHHYLRFHDRSRETTENGVLAYDATVYIGWDKVSDRYVCLWLDSTAGSGLGNDVFGYAEPAEDKLAFVWGAGNETWHTKFIYDRETDTWRWTMDADKDGERTPFARVTLERKSR